MLSAAGVVVIGGGVTGCSIAYHLAKAGCKDVVLVEKGELTSGTTFHSVGLVSQFRQSSSLMQLQNYSIALYNEFRAEVGDGVGWHPVGSLRLASSENQLKNMARQVSRAHALGLNVGIISPSEARRHFPPMTLHSLYGAVHIPDDGWLEPNGITQELARRARKLGVAIYTNTLVIGIERSGNGAVKRVVTDAGSIDTEIVVNAAGQWAPRIGDMAGALVPLVPLMHQYLTTKPIAGHELPRTTPVIRDPDNLVYIREDVGGYLIGGFEPNPKPWSVEGVPWEFTQRLLPPEPELFEPLMEGALRRIPALEDAEVTNLINGPEAISPDGSYILGPVPGVRGFWVAAGMSLNGIAGAGGTGRLMAEWIMSGEPSIDLSEMNVRRFGPQFSDRHFVTARACEVYKYYYLLRFPNDENEWGRPLRVSPLAERLQALGAVFGEKSGWERVNYFDPGKPGRRAGPDQRAWGWGKPAYFDLVGAEHRAARERVALFDMTSFNKIDVRGPGALALLQRLADNNIDKPPGGLTYTQFLNLKGGIESDLTVTRLSDDYFRVTTGTAFGAQDMGWIVLHAPDDSSVAVTDVTTNYACLGLWGPDARNVLQAATRCDVGNAAFPYMTAQTIIIGEVTVLAQRVSYVGELGWELYMANADAVVVWDSLMSAGNVYNIRPAGYKALETLRLEKSYRYWSADITPADNPLESGQGFCVKWTKGDFLGREALLKIKEQGLSRKLCPLTIDPNCVIYGGEAVYSGDRVVGRVRSGGFGYTLGTNVGCSYLPLDLAQVGVPLTVDVLGNRVPAQVARDPLYDPKGERVRA